MGLALEEPKEGDDQMEIEGVPFIVGQDLARWLQSGHRIVLSYSKFQGAFRLSLSGLGGC